MRLEINVHDDRKIVEIWLSHSEQAGAALREQLRPIYQEYNGENFPRKANIGVCRRNMEWRFFGKSETVITETANGIW